MTTVISLGGSVIAPEWADTHAIGRFTAVLRDYLRYDDAGRLVLVVGGGGPARAYQQAFRELVDEPGDDEQDLIGIMATRLNAELVRAVLGDMCADPLVTDPGGQFSFTGRVLVGAGWKPGSSTDYIAVILAERLNADRLINISNIDKIYSADPAKDPHARPLDRMSWNEYRKLIGGDWVPGKNCPFDPVASRRAAELGMEVFFVGGRDMDNIRRVLEGKTFFGSRIG
ncbi:MAG: UMP kinase [Salinispira sp.]